MSNFLYTWEKEGDADYAESLIIDADHVFQAVRSASVWASANLLSVVPAEFRNAEPLTFHLPLKGVVIA